MRISQVKFDEAGQVAYVSLPFRKGNIQFVVDAADAPPLKQYFSAISAHEPRKGKLYIRGYHNRCQVPLNRFLLELSTGDPLQGDHKNGDTLDYRRGNLRSISVAGNSLNKLGVRSDSSSGVRGVYRTRHGWRAMIHFERLGRFADIRDAAEAVWKRLLKSDPVAAGNYLRSLPEYQP